MENIIIIGSGPAGYTAGLYASRAGLNPLMLSGQKIGGQLTDTKDVENYPGYREPVTGPEMMDDFRHQAEKYGTRIVKNYVEEVDFSQDKFMVKDDRDNVYYAKTIIISTGAATKWLNIPSETKLRGSGVSSCATCDGFFFKQQDVVVVGGGDSAAEEALYLSNICKSVTVLVRKDYMKASQIMQDRLNKNNVINIQYNTSVDKILGDDMGVTGVRTNHGITINCMGVFIAIGHAPATEIFQHAINTDKLGYIITQAKSTATNVPGAFACGDVQDSKYRQAITAAGSGCMAALDAERYIQQLN